MLKTEQDCVKQYQDYSEGLKVEISSLAKRIDQFSLLRLAQMVLEIVVFVALASSSTFMWQLFFSILLLVPVGVFVLIVRKQNALSIVLSFKKNLLWVYENEISVSNSLPNGYSNGELFEDERHAYLSDLDIFGKSSLYALINRAGTKLGINQLAKSLSQPKPKAEILARQNAINELVEDLPQTFAFRAHLKGTDVNRIDELKHKISTQLYKQLEFTSAKLLRLYAKFCPALAVVFLLNGLIFGGEGWAPLIVFVLSNLLLNYLYNKQISQVYYGFSGTSNLLNSFAEAVKWTEQKKWRSTYIKQHFHTKESVSNKIDDLKKIITAFDARLNFLLFAILNFLFLWDIRCCIRLAEWNADAGVDVVNGLDRIGYFEELISIATLKYNHPSWVFPAIADEFELKCTAIGHPLIVSQNRVTSDFELLQKPTVDIITGSNMAGKSTFLRTLGINMVLAYAGAPVCASYMQVSIFKLLTYMRIKDNLIESTSTFKAELDRLKMILGAVEQFPNAFVLIDEMLRGTNSKDKYDGSKAFIQKLIGLARPTLFATHDLQLSTLEQEYPLRIRNFHFDIQITETAMAFDYKIKNGPCTQFNAAILLKQIGL